jgi:hypothetical protein
MKHCQRHGPEKDPYCVDCWKDERERDALCPSDATTCSPSSLTRETDQLEECDQYKVDEDYAEYNAYRRMIEHARTLERERDEYRRIAGELIAAIRINAKHGTFATATIEDVDQWLKQWTDKFGPKPTFCPTNAQAHTPAPLTDPKP